MNRTSRILLAFYGVVIILTASCHKSGYEASTPTTVTTQKGTTTPSNEVSQLFGFLHPFTQTLTVTAGIDQTIQTDGGTKLHFYPFSFIDGNNKIISSGNITLQIVEIYGPGIMIASRSAATSNGKLLQNAGQINITATNNGQAVFANKYGVAFKAQAPSPESFSLYYGSPDPIDSFINWNATSGLPGTITNGTVADSITIVPADSAGYGHDTMVLHTNYNEFDSVASFGWVSGAAAVSEGINLTNVTIMPADTMFNGSNTAIFLIFPGSNSVTCVSNYNATSHSFSLPSGYYVPYQNIKVKIVAIAYVNGNYYYQMTETTLFNSFVATPTLTAISLQLLIQSLSLL